MLMVNPFPIEKQPFPQGKAAFVGKTGKFPIRQKGEREGRISRTALGLRPGENVVFQRFHTFATSRFSSIHPFETANPSSEISLLLACGLSVERVVRTCSTLLLELDFHLD